MNQRQLQDFVDVCEAGSFAAAARRRNVAPSTLSRSIAGLEGELGARLFERSTRRLRLTDMGGEFLETANRVTRDLREAAERIRDKHSRPRGRLRVTASNSFAQEVVVPALADFTVAQPEIQVDLVAGDQITDLLSSPFDLALRHGHLRNSSLIAKKLCDVRYGLYASPDYLSRVKGPRQPEQLEEHALVGFTHLAFRDQWILQRGAREVAVQVKPQLRLSSAIALRDLLRRGLGIGMLPHWCDAQGLQPVLRAYRVRGQTDRSAIWIVRPSRLHTPGKVRAFTEFLLGLGL